MSALPTVPDSVKDKATDVLLNMVNVTVQTMSDVVDFGKQQIPEVIHQLLMWKALESFIQMMLSFVVTLAVVIVCIIFYRSGANKRKLIREAYDAGEKWTRWNHDLDYTSTSNEYDGKMCVAMVFMIASAVIATIVLVSGLNSMSEHIEWLKIWVAPKVYLIEYAAELIKSAKA